jgi:hypothetical protein
VPASKADDALAAAEKALLELAQGTDLDEFMTQEELDDNGEDDLVFDEDGFINERHTLTADELKEHSRTVLPIRLILVKVSLILFTDIRFVTHLFQIRKLAFALIHSSTLLLPEWFRTLKAMGIPEHAMPRDVSTRWNSTFNMLNFACEHKAAVNSMTANIDNKLRVYEMSSEEWGYAEELREVLKVRELDNEIQ